MKRKKAMNIVLLVLITLASTLVASSTNLMYSTSTAIGSFISHSRVADLNITLANTPEYNRAVTTWANGNKSVSAYHTQLQIGLLAKDITVPDGRRSFSGNTGLVLSTLPDNVNLVFGGDNKSFNLREGEIGLPVSISNATGLKPGDELTVKLEGISKEFTVREIFKDAFLGADLLGLKRLMISQEDFKDIQNVLPEESMSKLWSFVAAPGVNYEVLSSGFTKENLPINFEINKGLVEMSYMTDKIIAAILFAISLFLIFIAFLTLRFTIVSTLQDDYKEIGVMKAIGFTNSGIKGLYLTKYLGLAVAGGAAGLGISLPLTRLMSSKISQYIIMPGGMARMVVSVLSAAAIIGFTLLFCSLCMRRINKASPIDAIRQGHTGERFRMSRRIQFHRTKLMPPALFLAIGDILTRMKSYTALILTFILSTAIIIIPINLTNTIVTPKFISYFGIAQADFYTKSEVVEITVPEVQSRFEVLTKELRDKGYDVTLSVNYSAITKYISDNGEENRLISGMKSEPAVPVSYLEGTAPKLENEIAITSVMAGSYKKAIGDSIIFEIDGKQNTFLITGIFQTISNEGYMVRLSDEYPLVSVVAFQFAGEINAAPEQKSQVIEEMKKEFSELDIKSASDLLGELTGGFMGQLQSINALLIVIVCLVTFFITSLFVRLLITKEVQGIAVMKSLGFTNGVVRLWQVLRIMILLLCSIILGVLTGNILGEWLIGMIFRIFGLTQLSFNIVPLQVYVLYPLLIVIVVVLAVYTSCGQIKKIQVWSMNEE